MVSPLQTNVQVVNTHSHVKSRKCVHVSGIHCHMRASSASGCAFVNLTVQRYTDYSSTVSLFQAQDVSDWNCSLPSHEIKRFHAPWKLLGRSSLHLGRKAMTNLDSILKSRHHFADKSPYSQSYGFSSSHVWMWELDHKEGWAPKNWCFQTVVLEKTLESPLDSQEIKPVSPKGNQPWILIGRTDAKAEAPILWPPGEKSWLTGKKLMLGKIEGRRRRWRQRMRWLDGIINSKKWVWANSGR